MKRLYSLCALAAMFFAVIGLKAQNYDYSFFNPISASGSNYKAQKVVMNVGTIGTDINMTLLGETRGGFQVWYCKNTTGKYADVKFKIDDGMDLAFSKPNYESPSNPPSPPLAAQRVLQSTELTDSTLSDSVQTDTLSTDPSLDDKKNDDPWSYYVLVDAYGSKLNLKDGSQYVHFVKVVSQNLMFYAYCNESDGVIKDLREVQNPCNEGYYIEPTISISADEPVFIDANNRYGQIVKWNITGLTREIFDLGYLAASFDGGKTYSSGGGISKFTDSMLVRLPYTNNGQVKYIITLYPKDKFKYLVKNGYWQSEVFSTSNICKTGIPCTVSISYDKDSYTDNEDYAQRTYSPKVTWAVPYGMYGTVSNLYVEYRPCNSSAGWQKLADLKAYAGSNRYPIPAGHDSLEFRLVAKGNDASIQVEKDNVSETVLATTTFNPLLTVVVNDSVYNAAANAVDVKLLYGMNNDLWQTRLGSLDVYYSTDGGNKWTLAKTIDSPAKADSVALSVPGGAKEYKFRMGITSSVNNALTYCVKTANHDFFSVGIQSVENNSADGQPVKVFDLNGRYVGNSTKALPTGVYIVNGKKYTVQ